MLSSDFGMLCLEDLLGNNFLIDFPYGFNASGSINSFMISKLKNMNIVIRIAGELTNPYCIIPWMPGL
jgi:hypothetical protein